MIRVVLLGVLSLILFSCQEKEKPEPLVRIKKVRTELPEPDDFNYDTLKGIYTGDFGGSDIRIILNYVSGSNAIGYNLHKGLQRNLNGKVNRNGDSISIVLKEPGDHEYDGVFSLNFNGIDHEPTGRWVANSGEIDPKDFKLSKRVVEELDGEITVNNFTNYFYFMYDSLGNYSLSPDGLLKYEYYPKDENGDEMDQLISVQGSWNLNDSIVTFDWQENIRFKNRRMVFIIQQEEYEYENTLKGEGMTLHNHWY